MIKKIVLVLLFLAIPAFAADTPIGVFPDRGSIFSKSIVFTKKLNRTAPYIVLEPGTIVSAQNMRRPAPGVMAGWGPRRGMAKNNSTAIGSAAIESLHQFINPTFDIRCFLAQTNDKVYLATNDPPDTGTTFGTSQISLTANAGVMFSDSVGDDWVGAAKGTNPVAWSGGTAYPDGFKVVIGGATPDSITITNDDFETGNNPPTGWTESNGTAVTGTTAPQGGSKDVEVTSTAAGSSSAGIYQDIPAAAGVEYTISYWARRDSLVTTAVTNEGFETGSDPPTGWTQSNATAVSGTTDPHGGSKDAVVTPTAAESESAGIYQDVAVEASTDYTISYWAYRVNQGYEMTNAGFETGGTPPTGWTASNATAVSGTTNPYAGSKDAVVTPTTADSELAGIYQDVVAGPDVEYNVTYWAYHIDKDFEFTNGDFETGGSPPSGWTNNDATSASGTTAPHGGSKDAVITPTAILSKKAGIYQEINVEPSTIYTISFWAYKETGNSGDAIFYPAANQDDGYWWNTVSSGFQTSSGFSSFGYDGTERRHSFFRFQGVTIGQGANIIEAHLELTAYSSRSITTVNTNIYFEASNNAVAPTDIAEAEALSLTSGAVWDNVSAWTNGTEYDTVDLKTPLQEVIDRGGFSSGNAVMVVIKDDGSTGTAYRSASGYEHSSGSEKPELHVEIGYSLPALTIECYDSEDGLISTVESNTYTPNTSTWTFYDEIFQTPADTSYIRVYLASYTNAVGTVVEFDDVTLTGTYPQSHPSHVIQALDSGSSVLSTLSTQANSPSDSTWTEYSKNVTTPASTAYLRIYLGSKATAGFLDPSEFDGVSYAPISEPYPQTNPSHVMQALDSGHDVLSTLDTQENTPSDSTWTKYSTDVTTPVATAYIRLYLGAKAPSTDFLNEVEFDDVEFANTSGGPFPSHVMQFLDVGDSVLETASTQNNEPTVGEWVQYSAQGISPATTTQIRLYLGCNSTPLGETVQFDTLTSIVAVPLAGLNVTDGYEEVRNNLTTRYIPYPASTYDLVYVGFRRPVDDIHLYLGGTPNSNVVSMAVYYWEGASSTWNPVGNLVDGTAISSATLAQSESLTWDASPSGETPRVLPGTSDDLYWYKLTPSGDLTSGLTVYKVTVSDNVTEIANLWSGYHVLASGALVDEGAGLVDYTGEVTDGTDVNVMPLDSLANTSEVYFGFEERAQGISIYMVGGKSNGDATVAAVKHWDGDSWVSVGDILDGTSDGTDSLAQTGMIQWDGDAFREIKMVLGGLKIPYFWYQLSWSNALDSEVEIWEVSFASKPDPLEKYSGMVSYNNYALWWPGLGGAGTIDYSQQGYAHIMNGPFSGTTLPIFGGGEVNAITMLGTSAIVSTKNPYKIFFLDGAVPVDFTSVLVSDKVGAMAPKTLVSIDSGMLLFNKELQVRAVVFLAADGVYMTDGSTLYNISTAISDYFDTSSGPYIEPEYMDISYAWINHEEKTVHFAVPMNVSGSGTQKVLNREIVYAYLTDEWYDVYLRNTAANCGLDLIGSENQHMTYIGGFLGYVYRSNTGTADGTTAITHKIKTSPILPLQGLISDPLNYSSILRRIKIKGKADTTSNAVANITVFPDAKTTGVSAGSISLENSGYGNVSGALNVNQSGDEFAFEFESTLADATMQLYGFTIDFMPQRPE